MRFVLDTSAVLAHYLGEPGRVRVRELLQDANATVGISSLTLYELETRLSREGISAQDRDRTVRRYTSLTDEIVPVTAEIAALGAQLREESPSRIAAVDCLIAATALSVGAMLVHRDAHFAALPAGRPSQEALPDKI